MPAASEPAPPWRRRAIQWRLKRGVDILGSLFGLVALGPALATIAIAVRLDSPGGALFGQARVGRFGRPFRLLKFRTMVENADKQGLGLAIEAGDRRITRVGHFLRRYSLDELPQLINVLKGEMSLIGPRPTLPYQVARYTPAQRRRLLVRPGLTGWAQVNGRNQLTWPQRIALDLWYIDNWSLALDALIVWRTPKAVLNEEALYTPWVVDAISAVEPADAPATAAPAGAD